MFDFDPFNDIADEQIEALPEEHRQLWIDTREARRQQVERIEQLAQARDFIHALVLVDSKERAHYMVDFDERYSFTDDEARRVLAEFWSITEAWSGDERLREGMYGLIKRVAPIYEFGDPKRPLPRNKRLTIYRGNLGEEPGKHMMSWTLDRQVAEMFARMGVSLRGKFLGMYRPDGVPSIWDAYVDRKDVLGYFDDRGEREVVVDGSTLREVQLIAQAVKP